MLPQIHAFGLVSIVAVHSNFSIVYPSCTYKNKNKNDEISRERSQCTIRDTKLGHTLQPPLRGLF